jgi:hypothetical protein
MPMARGFVYLTAVVDWASRRVLAHRVAITLEAEHAVAVLEEALAKALSTCRDGGRKTEGKTMRNGLTCSGKLNLNRSPICVV